MVSQCPRKGQERNENEDHVLNITHKVYVDGCATSSLWPLFSPLCWNKEVIGSPDNGKACCMPCVLRTALLGQNSFNTFRTLTSPYGNMVDCEKLD